MTDKLDAVEYKNGQKNNWRLHTWNRISEAVENKREAVVLYAFERAARLRVEVRINPPK